MARVSLWFCVRLYTTVSGKIKKYGENGPDCNPRSASAA